MDERVLVRQKLARWQNSRKPLSIGYSIILIPIIPTITKPRQHRVKSLPDYKGVNNAVNFALQTFSL